MNSLICGGDLKNQQKLMKISVSAAKAQFSPAVRRVPGHRVATINAACGLSRLKSKD